MTHLQQIIERFEKKWDEVFPARNGMFLKGVLPRFKSKRDTLKNEISTEFKALIEGKVKEMETRLHHRQSEVTKTGTYEFGFVKGSIYQLENFITLLRKELE